MMKRNDPLPSVLKPLFAFFLCLFVAAFAVRQKKIAALPETVLTKVEPAVFYLEDKNITITTPEKVSVPKESSTKRKRKTSDARKDIRITPEPLAPDEPPVPPSHPVLNTYVAVPQLLEFTIIDPVTVDVPDITCESPHPYIQKSSFYFTEIDTTAGKKVIVL